MGNGLMAIVAGLFAQMLVSNLDFGPVAPFDAAAVVMVIGGLLVLFTWSENYGDPSEKTTLREQAMKAGKAIIEGPFHHPPPPPPPPAGSSQPLRRNASSR